MNESAEKLRHDLRAWLDTAPRPEGLRDYGATPTAADVPAGRRWQRQLAEAGWACIAWPVEHGGRAATLPEQAAFAEECARAGVPRQLNIVGPDLAGPVLIRFGTTEQQQRWLERIRRGDDLWCQLFSEPDAGSDLSSLRTRAIRDGDGWIVEGRKVWSSGANSADLGLLLARTGSDRYDLSMFAVPMGDHRIEVTPLRQMDGETKFNEVVFDGVRLGPEHLIGSPGDGWKIAMSTLGAERVNLAAQAVALAAHLDEAIAAADVLSAPARQEAAGLWSRIWLLRAQFERLVQGGVAAADPRFSLLKLAATELQRDLVRFAVSVAGARALAAPDALSAATCRLLSQPGQTIAGGTSEIQRNILAERVLGLPRVEVRS